jgi:RimJ/RimL family protein N-acetyltransferase
MAGSSAASDLRLLRADGAALDAAADGDDAFAAALGRPVVDGWATFTERLRTAPAGRWGTRFFLSGGEVVGWGGFKGPPREGAVEIGYEIAASRQGRGLATAAARAMVAEAFADPRVARVLANTLPERNASNHILEKIGFRFEGEALVRGTQVWRYAASPRPRADSAR